jgi:F-type H+-transporting ATPase subunit b
VHTLFAAASSSPGLFQALGLDWKLLVEQAIAFLILVGILGKYVYPVLIKAIDDRRDTIEAGLKEAEKSRKDLEKTEAKIEQLFADARKEADAVLNRAQQEATGVVSDAEAKAKTRAERIIADAHNQLEADIIKARASLKRDTAELVALATEKIIHEKLDTTKDASLIERALTVSGSRKNA